MRSRASSACSVEMVSAGDAGAAGRRAHRELAPARPDLEDGGAPADRRAVEQPVDLAPLRVGQVVVGAVRLAVEDRRGVGQRLVQEGLEQVVGQVVVVVDVLARALDGVVVVLRLAAEHGVAQLVQERRNQVAHVRRERGEHAGEVVGRPVTGHVGLAEPDRAGRAEALEERGRADEVHHRRARRPAAVAGVVALAHAQRETVRGVAEDAFRDRGAHG